MQSDQSQVTLFVHMRLSDNIPLTSFLHVRSFLIITWNRSNPSAFSQVDQWTNGKSCFYLSVIFSSVSTVLPVSQFSLTLMSQLTVHLRNPVDYVPVCSACDLRVSFFPPRANSGIALYKKRKTLPAVKFPSGSNTFICWRECTEAFIIMMDQDNFISFIIIIKSSRQRGDNYEV